jgi:DMSO/TMAO reductase YedYZ molybdopterin-dependent catalytic subunit
VARVSRHPADITDRLVPVGRRVFLTIAALGVIGVVFGARIQSGLSRLFGNGILGVLPGGDDFRIYSVSGTIPQISRDAYRLEISGMVSSPTTLTVSDLEAMHPTHFTRDFQCVTGWRVPDVAWQGVRLSQLLDTAGVLPGAAALAFESYDQTDTESLTLDQARLPDVIVAYRMLGGPITAEHGGPVRLYVAPMFGYKSIKWLSAIRVVAHVEPGYWEQFGYPVNGWVDGTTGPTDPSAR